MLTLQHRRPDQAAIHSIRRHTVELLKRKAANGEIIAASQAYDTKASAENGIESVQKNAPDA